MKVKSLSLHGFKSFAVPTHFELDSGMVAIIGPNGSGKSNIVDAIRWVLGEQSYTQMRGRRTEDVIWSGSPARPQSGMAEVSITFDNSDGSMNLPYSEVTITRRAYRTGENEYLINRSRVRLRDILELTSSIGQAYTLVSQGTADEALSLSSESRRGLFEEAADITQHYMRRDEAIRRLREVSTNTQRVQDLLAELEPRRRLLDRQVKQLRERESLQTQLEGLLLSWYSSQLACAEKQLHETQQALSDLNSSIYALRKDAGRALEQDAQLTASERTARAQLEFLDQQRRNWDREVSRLRTLVSQCEWKVNESARRITFLEAETSKLEAEINNLTLRLTEAEQTLQTTQHELEQTNQEVTKIERSLKAEMESHQEARERHKTTTERLESMRREVSDLVIRRDANLKQVEGNEHALAALKAELEETESAVCRSKRDIERYSSERAALEKRLVISRAKEDSISKRLHSCEENIRRLEAERTELQAKTREQRARYGVLTDIHRTASGQNSSVQAVLAAAKDSRLHGIVGTLASLMTVPAHLERAIESCLGAGLQNIVVHQWSQAEAAIEYLKRSNLGRVTFLPLDTLRPHRAPTTPSRGGIFGIASDLVTCEAAIRPAVEYALGRVLVVENVRTARDLINMRDITLVVTLGGETVRPGGALTGGAPVRNAGTLSRAREIRELPVRIAGMEGKVKATQSDIATISLAREQIAEEFAREQKARQQLETDLQAARNALAHAQTIYTDAMNALPDINCRIEARCIELESARARGSQLGARLDMLSAQASALAAEAQTEEQSWHAYEYSNQESHARLAGSRTRAAVLAERAKSAELLLRGHRDQLEKLRSRRDALLVERTQIESRKGVELDALDDIRNNLHDIERKSQEADQAAEPLEAHLQSVRHERDKLRSKTADISSQRLQLEEKRLTLSLKAQHAEDFRRNLLERAQRDIGHADVPMGLPEPPQAEQQIEAIRLKLSRTDSVNPLAKDEYAEVESRVRFLREQLADLDTSRNDLEQLASSLENQMRTRFEETFGEVSEKFARNFAFLFGGGSAQLALVDKGDAIGVEIQAEPPGKRAGNLTLLSGGERALTSCALLFALIEVGKAPFCVLDEVDAALDESNVGRFCDLLRTFEQQTQMIVITHNRGTIERSDHIYGVTMEGSGISKVLSLKLEPDQNQSPEHDLSNWITDSS